MVEAADSALIVSKRKAISSLFPYAIFLEQGGQQAMIDAILCVARIPSSQSLNPGEFLWHHVILYISRLFERRSPTSLNRVITQISPFVPWDGPMNNTVAVARWVTAASATPYTEEVGRSVIDTLFQIALIDFLRPQIPIEIWIWLKRRPSLPLMHHGKSDGTRSPTIAYVHKLGDIDLLKSYLLLVWTDRWRFDSDHLQEVESLIRDRFGGVGMEHHRKDLVERVDHVLEQLDQRPETPSEKKAKKQYTKFRTLLLELDKR